MLHEHLTLKIDLYVAACIFRSHSLNEAFDDPALSTHGNANLTAKFSDKGKLAYEGQVVVPSSPTINVPSGAKVYGGTSRFRGAGPRTTRPAKSYIES